MALGNRHKFYMLIGASLVLVWFVKFEFDRNTLTRAPATHDAATCSHLTRLVRDLQKQLSLNQRGVLPDQKTWAAEQEVALNNQERDVQLEGSWVNRETCEQPASNIAFLKMHKCASTTIQNILMRYGEKHNLTFALPSEKHIFPLEKPFEASFVHEDAPFHTDRVNIFCMHTKWNKKEVSKILHPGAVYFTIVREPKSAFLSLYDYFAFTTLYKMNISQFILTHDIETKRFMGCMSYNVMACDFGAMPGDYSNPQTIVDLTRQMDEDFDLVMVAERMEESLVLLAHLLCWSYDDVVAVSSNTRHTKKTSLSPEVSAALSDRLVPDYHIYNYFTQKFDKLVKAFGEDRMAKEVEKLRQATEAKLNHCQIERTKPKQTTEEEKAGSSKVEKLKTKSEDPECKALVREEQAFVRRLKQRQAERFQKL